MAENTHMQQRLKAVLASMMEEVMRQVLAEDLLTRTPHITENPLYMAFVPNEILKCANFNQCFEAVFRSAWGELALEAAKAGLGFGAKRHVVQGYIKTGRLRRINSVLNPRYSNLLEYYESKGQQNLATGWNAELAYIMKGRGRDMPVKIVCDVYAEDTVNNLRYAFELNAPPSGSYIRNRASKEKFLKLYSMDPPQVEGAYFALPYNPYSNEDENNLELPSYWFNMREDEVVLIGDEFWDKIGGTGTYQSFISAVNEIGQEYRYRIYREFLGIEPPPDAGGNVL